MDPAAHVSTVAPRSFVFPCVGSTDAHSVWTRAIDEAAQAKAIAKHQAITHKTHTHTATSLWPEKEKKRGKKGKGQGLVPICFCT